MCGNQVPIQAVIPEEIAPNFGGLSLVVAGAESRNQHRVRF